MLAENGQLLKQLTNADEIEIIDDAIKIIDDAMEQLEIEARADKEKPYRSARYNAHLLLYGVRCRLRRNRSYYQLQYYVREYQQDIRS